MLHPCDIVVLLKLSSQCRSLGRRPSDASMASALGASLREITAALGRASVAHLYRPDARRVSDLALLEFLTHGIRYAFPATLVERRRRGVPTAWSAAPLADRLFVDPSAAVVWATTEFPVQIGSATVAPLDARVPAIAVRDRVLHGQLAAVDAIRVGRSRDVVAARELLAEALS